MSPRTFDIPPVYFFGAILLMLLLHRTVPGLQLLQWPWRWLGLLPIVAGVALSAAGAFTFRRAGTAVRPFSEPSALVTSGPFAYTRNPMYLGLTFGLIGWALLLGSAVPVIVIPLFVAMVHHRFILREEPFMAERFGDAYRAYKARVRRWL